MNDDAQRDSHDVLVEADRKAEAQRREAATATIDEQEFERGRSVSWPKKDVNADG